MLALTRNAAEAVEAIVTQPEAPDGGVLRITSDQSPSSNGADARDLQMYVVETPEAEDVKVPGIAISVEPETVHYLDDKVLDAEFADGGVKFSLYLQPQASSENGTEPPA